MKYHTFLLLAFITVNTCVPAQSTHSNSPEFVYPFSVSFNAAKGASNFHFADSLNGTGFVKSSSDYIITSDGGETWRSGRPHSMLDSLQFLWTTGKDTLVAIVDSQYVYHSYDGGVNWDMVGALPFGEKIAYGLFFNHKYGVIFKKSGGVIVSADLGANWQDSYWQFGDVIQDLKYDKGYLLAYKKHSITQTLIYSSDNGFSWQSVPLNVSIRSLDCVAKSESGFFISQADAKCFLLSTTGQVLKSFRPWNDDYRNTFVFISENEVWGLHQQAWDNKHLRRFSFADTIAHVFPISMAAGDGYSIIQTTANKLLIYANDKFQAVWCFYKSAYPGTGVEQTELPGKQEASTLHFVNGTKGIVALKSGSILLTNDGGRSWINTSTPQPAMVVRKFVQRSESELYGIGDNGNFLVTSDGGYNWSNFVSPFTKTIVDASFAGRDTLFFITADSLYFTSPSLQEVTKVATPFSGGVFQSVNFYGGYNGTVIYQINESWASKAFITTDRGATWTAKAYTDKILTYDPSSWGLYYLVDQYMSAGVFAPVTTEGIGRKTTHKGILSPGDARKFKQKEGGLIAFMYSTDSFFYNFGIKDEYRRFNFPSEMEGIQVVPADENTAYLLCGKGRILKFFKSQQPQTPSEIIRLAPWDGSPYVLHNTQFKWEEPWSVSPVSEYNIQFATGDPSNIVHDIYGIHDTAYILPHMADSTLYFWRVRAANRSGWGSFNKWYSFRSSTTALEPVAYTTPLRGDLTAGIMLPNGRLIVSNNYGELAFTNQPPGNWSFAVSRTSYPILRFSYDPNNDLVFYLTDGNFLGYSGNKGLTWSRKEAPLGSTMITSISSLSPNFLFASGYYGSIFKAVGGVTSWTNVWFAPNAGDFRHINTSGTDKVAAVGDNGNITLSTDGGQTFRYITHSQLESYKRVSFAPDGTIVVLNQRGERRVSTDMGDTWTFESFHISTPVRDMISQNGTSVVIDTVGGVFISESPTSVWRYLTLPLGTSPMGVEISGNTILITARGYKFFYLTLNSGNPVGVEDAAPVTDFTLTQNYPNPFNPETVIRYALPVAGFARGVVYDILGREVATLINGEMPAGEHRLSFNATNLPSGVYIFRLESGKYSAAIKMLLSK